MEKLRLTAHINDIELKNKMYKVIDKANSCLKNYDIRTTEFLNPFEIKNAKDILNSETDLKYKVDGGYQNAERQLIYIFPYYMEEDDIESNLKVIQIEGNFKFKSISHRDYLGALLNLGIKREKIGEIIFLNIFSPKNTCPKCGKIITPEYESTLCKDASFRGYRNTMI